MEANRRAATEINESASAAASASSAAVSDDVASADAPRGHGLRGIICAALGGVCWGFSGNCAQLLTVNMDVPVMWVTAWRLVAAACLFLVVCLVREPRQVLGALRDGPMMAYIAGFAVLGVLLTQVSYLSAISYTNAGTGTVLERTGVVLIMGYVCLRTRRWPHGREVAGLALAIGGTVLIATQGDLTHLAIAPQGLFWGMMAAVALAFYNLMPGKPLAKWGSLIVPGFAMAIAAAITMVAVRPWTMPVTLTPELCAVMAVLVAVGTFASYLFYLQGVADAGPVRAGLVGCVEPVSANIISALWLGTPLTGCDFLGCAMIVGTVILVTGRPDHPDHEKVAHYDGSKTGTRPFRSRFHRSHRP